MDRPLTTGQNEAPDSSPHHRSDATVQAQPLPPMPVSPVRRYGLALFLVAAATLLTQALVSLGSRPSFGLFFLAALLSAWYGGLRPGILTTLLSALAGAYFFVPSAFSLAVGEGIVQTGVFVLVGLLTTLLAAGRRQAEAALREQREHYRVTLTSIGDAVIATDIEGRITFMNGVAEMLTGWPLAEAQGQPLETVFRIVNETTRSAAENPVRRVIQSGQLVGLANHTILLTRAGREIPIDDSAAPVRDNQGQISGVVLVFGHLTGRRRDEIEGERLLRENQQQRLLLQQLIENAPAGIAILAGPDHRYSLVNPEYMRIAQDKGNPIGRTVAEVWPEVASQIVPLLDQVYQTGEPYSLSDASFLVNIDGGLKEACFNFSYTPLKDDTGQVSGILALVQETTAQVNAHRQIEEAHALLDTIFTSAPIGLGFWDRELRFTRLNPALAEMNGLPVEAHLGKTPGEVLPNLVDLQQVMETWRQVIETGQPLLNVEINGETPARPGEPRTWLESWYPVKVGQETIGLGAVVQEITERKRMEEQLTAALAEKETLLKEVYHRIKNNLQGVSNLLYLQSLHLQEDSESRRAFEDTRNRIKAIALIHDKLHRSMDLARLDFADYILSLARQLVQSFKIDAGLIKLEVDFDDVLIDPKVATSLGIIVNELLTNALKHAFPPELDRQGELQIKLYAVDEEYMCLSVRDNGIGLPENFDPAATESLGLQLVTTLTASLQGRVELEREGGTIFRILLPRPG